jgi:hypothetical protein
MQESLPDALVEELLHRSREAAVEFDDLLSQLSERLIPQQMKIELTTISAMSGIAARTVPA